MSKKIRIAVQKSGRLSEDSLALFKECGLEFDNSMGQSRLLCEARNFPLELLFLRDDDIPRYVADGVTHCGIVGENVVAETNAAVRIVERLGFSKCRLSIAVPRGEEYQNITALTGKKIATSYPALLSRFLKEKGVSATIHEISGSVEIAPGIGLSDAICDLVGSGSTLVTNGLKEVEVILRSEAILIAGEKLDAEQEGLIQQLLFRIQSVQRAKRFKYILLNAPNSAIPAITEILPGMKSPTVVPLALEGWSSVHSVLNEDDFWNNIESLRAAGAQGILVIPIEKMIQ